MKIGDIKDTTSQMVQQYQQYSGANQAMDKPATAAATPEEKVDLSTRSKELLQIKNAVAQLPEIREEKVQELKTQIEKGTYNINGGQIAEKMIGESLIDIFS
ncbi:MAG: flagellar biosynthesis anti-sigma factor FlgM [Deltaproteobacteria bacterium]|nr:flagellar biosynthesis anti-sigma factor FlgM [Deltaproteobacteria bacterium]